jgi:hypothetical protein
VPAEVVPLARSREAVLCSFHTPDDYYAGHAAQLRERLESLGLPHELLEVERTEDEDWADVTRRKIGFIHDVCRSHPDALVLWIDVDCRITHLPDYVRDSTADIIGFQRSFRPPLQIGYHNRARFWEPSFWGVNATEQGRKLIADAHALEQRSTIRATDDYFLEEAWRANAPNLTFQMIPSSAIVRNRRIDEPATHGSFFVFGSSGNVAEFKDKVVQHKGTSPAALRKKALARAKRIERALPDSARRPMRRLVDSVGVTGALTADAQRSVDPERTAYVNTMLGAGMVGDVATFEAARVEFDNRYIPVPGELATREVAEAFLEHSARGSDVTLRLAWWSKPFPGNFGDWLSPLAVAHVTGANIRLQSVTKATNKPHLVALGSIGRFIRPSSIVVGTGVSRDDLELASRARHVSVRGPITARVLRDSGGLRVERFGDPGVLLSRILPVERGATNGRIALVRHHAHRHISLQLPDHVDELSVLRSRPADIEAFVGRLAQYDAVITSAMHVMAACQSYGIPCGLVTFDGFEDAVHGTGIKYEDYARGVGVEVLQPVPVGLDLRHRDLDALVHDVRVSEEVKDDVAAHLRVGVAHLLDAMRARQAKEGRDKGKRPKAARAADGAKGSGRAKA